MDVMFTVEGGVTVSWELVPVKDFEGRVCGFKTPSGKILRFVVALEVESDDSCEYITSEQEMESYGVGNLEYSNMTFYEVNS